jgi:hypothetical protein
MNNDYIDPVEGGLLERLPMLGRFARRCDHRWSEPVIMRMATHNSAAAAQWSCLDCGKRSEHARAA